MRAAMDWHLEKYYNDLDKLLKHTSDPEVKKKIPIFFFYFGDSLSSKEGLRYYLMETALIFDFLQAKKKDVLEIGCGLGLKMIFMSLLGSRKTIGIDISEEVIQDFQTLLQEFPQLNVEAQKGDFLLTNYPPNSFDAVMLINAISHIRDTLLLLDRIKNVLRPGGVLYIADGNNDLFFDSMIRSRKAWRKAEWGSTDMRERERAKYGRRVDKLCFFDARMGIIKSLYPSIDDQTLSLIARKTQGMYGLEITRAVGEFMATGRVHEKASFPYRNPYTGEFPELGINPFKLLENLKARGFRCKLMPPTWAYIGPEPHVPYLGTRSRLSLLNNLWYSRTSRLKTIATRTIYSFLRNSPDFLFPFLSPSFQIIALKEKE